MSSKSTFKGYILSSTPVHPPEEDSGYCGSSRRRNFNVSNENVFNTYSPTKELCFKNLSDTFSLEHDIDIISPQPTKRILDYENFMNDVYESCSLEKNEFSELEMCGSSVEEDKMHDTSEQQFLCELSSSEDTGSLNLAFSSPKDEDIKYQLSQTKLGLKQENFNGFKQLDNKLHLSNFHVKHESQSLTAFKQTNIDFLHYLNRMNCLSLVSSILSYLSAEELCTASRVNKEWNQIIKSDWNANCRRKIFIKERKLFFNGPSKENRLGMRSGPTREPKKPFLDITNSNADDHPLVPKDLNTRFDSFMRESGNGHLKLRKCPKCCYASRSLNGNNYKCTHCSHIFCSSCLDPVFKNHTCHKIQLPNLIIGSKKSKKNLKRL